MSNFETLMATLNAIDAEAQPEEMAKSFGNDKKDPSAKGKPETEAEGEYEKKEEKPIGPDEKAEEEDDEEEEGEIEKCSMTKSFQNEEGEELVDATEILESLQKSFASHDSVLEKVAGLLSVQNKQLKAQGELIKSMQQAMSGLSGKGTGRKSTVTLLTKSQVSTEKQEEAPQEMTKETVMAKAMTLFDQNKLSSIQVNMLDVALRNGYAPDAEVLGVIARN
ncbi:hypothetical protein BIW22_20985 [Salmonella enterica]|nr:hypothetical protein [Salmonella enterica]